MRPGYVTSIARAVAPRATVHVAAPGPAETPTSRDQRCREVQAGGAMVGFAHHRADAKLDMPEGADPVGPRALVTSAPAAPVAA